MKKRTFFIISISVVGIFIFWTGYLWKKFSCGIAGSFVCAETWQLKIPEKDLIEIIKEIKIEHPDLEPPNAAYPTSGRHEYWYDNLFHYKETNEDIHTWTRQSSDPAFTTIALISISTHIDSLTPISEIKSDRREINRDLSWYANKKEIWRFENRILDLINQKIKERQ